MAAIVMYTFPGPKKDDAEAAAAELQAAGWELEKFEQGYITAAADFSANDGGKAVAVGRTMWVVLGTKK